MSDQGNFPGETTGSVALAELRDKMLADPVGREILEKQPRITTETVPVQKILETHSPDTFGYAYAQFMSGHGFYSDDRPAAFVFIYYWPFSYPPFNRPTVRLVDDPTLAYVMQRYREVHDFWHVLSGFETTVEAEVALKWFEFFQTGSSLLYILP